MTQFQAGRETETFSHDNLIAGGSPVKHKAITLDNVSADLKRGTVLGKITLGAISAEPGGGNTGNGTIGSLARGANAKAGDYILTCLDATALNFSVVAPDGTRLDDAVAGAAYENSHLGFEITDGGTGFAVGDSFTVTIAAGSGQYVTSLAAATDGSQTPEVILVEDVTAPDEAADVDALGYTAGSFLGEALTLGTGHTLASIKDGLHDKGIYLA